MDKWNLLYKCCIHAGYECARQSFENVLFCWAEERNINLNCTFLQEDDIPRFLKTYGAWIGFPTIDDVKSNFIDQSAEYLFGYNQADVIDIDMSIFNEFKGNNHWEVLDNVFGVIESSKIVQDAFEEGATLFYNQYFNDELQISSQQLICRKLQLIVDCDITASSVEDLDIETLGIETDSIIEYLTCTVEPLAIQTVCRPMGLIDAGKLESDLIDAAIDILDKDTKNQLFIRREGFEDEPIPNEWLLEYIGTYYEDSSTIAPFAGDGIIECVSQFLKQGKWHLDYKVDNSPFLWFGLDNTAPIDIWSLPFISNRDYTSWKTMWFRDFWALDWNAILGGSDNYYTVWMFCELGMDEPESERDHVRNICPISISQDDTTDSIIEKISKLK